MQIKNDYKQNRPTPSSSSLSSTPKPFATATTISEYDDAHAYSCR